jgi:hypothetical protein
LIIAGREKSRVLKARTYRTTREASNAKSSSGNVLLSISTASMRHPAEMAESESTDKTLTIFNI